MTVWPISCSFANLMSSFLAIDSRSMSYLPSVTATAIMLHVVNCGDPPLEVEDRSLLLDILDIDKVVLHSPRSPCPIVIHVTALFDPIPYLSNDDMSVLKNETFSFRTRSMPVGSWSQNTPRVSGNQEIGTSDPHQEARILCWRCASATIAQTILEL